MTTVINLNILNVFGLNSPRDSVNKDHRNTLSSIRSENSFPDQRTIDVTPANAAISYDEPALDKISKVPVEFINQPEILTCYPQRTETYKLNGYSTSCFLPKGTNIDSYA